MYQKQQYPMSNIQQPMTKGSQTVARRGRRVSGKSAFTLIEVLAAMAVLVILVLALTRMFVESASITKRGTTTLMRNSVNETAMDTILQKLCVVFPLRHYYLLYVNQALNGYSIVYVWHSVLALAIFALLPLLTLHHYRRLFINVKYIP